MRFFQRTYFGAGAQKNWAMKHVRYPWVFLLDSDERCTPGLRAEIEDLLAEGPKHNAYTINRDVYFLGKRIKYSGWQRDRVARLFRDRNRLLREPPGPLTAPHHRRGAHPQELHGTPHGGPELRRVRLSTRQVRLLGRRPGVARRQDDRAPSRLCFVRLWRFFRTYIIQLGILDGGRGLVFCALQAYSAYMKYAILWGWRTNAARGIEPNLPEFDDDDATWEGLESLDEADDENDDELAEWRLRSGRSDSCGSSSGGSAPTSRTTRVGSRCRSSAD